MFDHIGFPVSNLLHSKRFYQTALEPLGVGIVMELTAEQTGTSAQAGFGENGKPYFWIGDGEGVLRGRLHVAFTAKTRADVDAFHKAALAAGGRDNGKPGLRPHYHAHYYGAFVLDPDGHNIEAVCHSAEA
jgi:catechol 2,3-dioxygenase-like lactoylglutathione lyase family enzyme